jgi:hypothetical protein
LVQPGNSGGGARQLASAQVLLQPYARGIGRRALLTDHSWHSFGDTTHVGAHLGLARAEHIVPLLCKVDADMKGMERFR